MGQHILGVVRILIFIDEDILKAVLIFFPYVFFFLQQAHGQEQEIVKIEGVIGFQLLFIQVIDIGYLLFVKITGPAGKCLGAQKSVLCPGNSPQD